MVRAIAPLTGARIVGEALGPGARVGFYEIVGRLGAGGMGEVYRARDTRLGRTVALKVLRSGADPELLHRLDREARAASALNHPNIVHIYDVGVEAGATGAHYVAMEHVEGETLRRRLSRGALPIPELLDLGAQLGDGLAKAHRVGIVHRDLKPENVMITLEGVLKILDFGLAKVVVAPLGDIDMRETLSRHATQAGMLLGTLEYMSPEQAAGRAVDHRTDQFSLGLILAEMAIGRPLFRRETPAQVLAAVIERDPEPLRLLRPDAPTALEALVSRCLQKDPARRFDRTEELSSELAALARRSQSGSLAAAGPSTPSAPAPVSAEVLPPPPPVSPMYHVQGGRGRRGRRGRSRLHRYSEEELAHEIRRGKLIGVELVRQDGEEEWKPLFESHVFRREVPTTGDPRDAARWRLLRALGGHFTGFFIVGVVMLTFHGRLPFWMAIWGAVLALQAVRALPAAWTLWQRRQVEGGSGTGKAALPPAGKPALPQALGGVPPTIAEEGGRVRALIEERGGSDKARLIADVDRILKLTAGLVARIADLEEQTSDRERAAVATAVTGARARLERAASAQDRRLFELQLKVVEGRETAIAKAVHVLERLRVRRELAEHQLKQLRLDLSRGAAGDLDVPELSSRLEFIRFEIDAKEEIEERDAARGI
jgi:serine/threonine protein kinase